MKRFTTITITFSLFVAILLLLFITKSKPVESLLRAPGRDEQNTQIWQVFENTVGNDYTLKTPTYGGHRSALIYSDLNNDGVDEIVVFYSKKGSGETVSLQIFSSNNADGWSDLAGTESGFNEVKQVEFADINGDGTNEIIVGWGLQSNKLLQRVDVYIVDYDSKTLNNIFSTEYLSFGVYDFDADKKSELAVISADNTVETATSRFFIYTYKESKVKKLASIEVDPTITTVSQLAFDYVRRFSCSRAYVDGYTTDGFMTTDMISFDIKTCKLSRVFVKEETVCTISKRNTNVECEDINADGIVEIPLQTELTLKSIKTGVIDWTAVLQDKVISTTRYFDNRANNYYFEIPQWLKEDIVPVLLSDGETLRFYYSSNNLVKNQNLNEATALFEIRTEFEDEDSSLSNRFKLINTHKGKNYYFRIFDAGNELGITKKLISSYIIFN